MHRALAAPGPGRASRARRRPPPRSPGRRTTGLVRNARAGVDSTRCACGPPYGSSSTGSRSPPGMWWRGRSTAVVRRRSPAVNTWTRGSSCGDSANDRSVTEPPGAGHRVTDPSWSSEACATTSSPPGQPARRHAPLRAHRARPGVGGTRRAAPSTSAPRPGTRRTARCRRRRRPRPRTCSSGPVTASPSTTSRRASSASAHQTSAPSSRCAGTPGTRSTQASSTSERTSWRRSRRRVDLPQRHALLVTRRGRHEQRVRVPGDRGEVLVAAEVDVGTRAVEAQQVQRHRRVGRPGGGVGDDDGLARRGWRGRRCASG